MKCYPEQLEARQSRPWTPVPFFYFLHALLLRGSPRDLPHGSPRRVAPTVRQKEWRGSPRRVAPTCRPDVSARRVTRCHKASRPVLSVLLHRLQGIGGEAESMRRVDHCVCFAVPAISRTISSAGVVPSPPCLPDGGIEEGRRHGLGNLA